ncbi:beta-glucoside-specific PTS transporter subunit IIABC [Lactococcus carnosus]|uniref:beta-glucoside-specific PTS transporter subunit IIABC n=1 Tax=Pseudolactococcus carnosus TaxID=2749961 RepID=UPI0008122885|nr:beta-glucoside-specific PTS transporter subunit IIABC [Lactococcus carnosus]SCA91013.1 phosphotransferase system (PTS) beta-glucoside-specific enzyme IIBCA component BglP [Lactococcus piscium]MCJ1969558.1 PTS transporter subunit EIIC [Lactococcus carnosus]MCJ1972706.1 PTS transporter subunit EIIC [Lactococcus carnosus]MCJ1975139.1 PTS transporter subunit EIIC [Lactococcus carnosus]MCJ1981473.1 PTS transporter subunit EIIC [Lactococcus carnosus]
MKKDYTKLADDIVSYVGGQENVISLYHCITRLRFKLKDTSIAKVNKDKIEKLTGVLSVVEANGQFQVVIGSDVSDVFQTILANYHIKNALDNTEADDVESDKTGNIVIRFFNTLSAIFNPIIIALAGAGMLKALLVVFTTYHLLSNQDSTYKILAAAGNSVFYFLPLFLAISAARIFKANMFISLAIVASLLEPNFVSMVVKNGTTVDFFGIPTVLMGYSGTVIPAIIAIYVYAHLEKLLKKFIPKSMEIFALSLVALIIMVPLTVLVIGPIGVMLGDGLGNAMNFISGESGLLAGLLIGGGWTFLVMMGIHWGVVPIMVNNLALHGYDTLRPMIAAATFASAGVALGVFLKSRNKETKGLALSSLLPALLGGITEPIVYGLSVKYKKPLIAQVIVGGLVGAFMGALQVKAIVYVFPALTTLPAFFGPTFIYYGIGITVAFFGTALLTYLLGLGEADQDLSSDSLSVALPLRGDVIPLSDVNDPVFSTLAMGNGFAIYPETGDILAPITGEVITVFPTGHAFGIRSALGTELLVHIGLNTVDLSKGTFNISVKKGDKVKKGQQIGTVNLAEIKEKNYDPTTMVIFTNGVKEQTLVVLDQSKNDITSVISKDAIERDGK